MEIGSVERIVISKGEKKGKKTVEVVYKTAAYRVHGKMKFISKTKHEFA